MKEGEAHYVLGFVLEMQGKTQEAVDQYWKASWTMGYQAAAFFRLAQIASRQKDYARALELIHKSLRVNVDHPNAQTVRAYLMRKNGQNDAAARLLQVTILQNPLDVMAKVELAFNLGYFTELCEEIFAEALRADDMIRVQEFLEVVSGYAALGAPEAFTVLKEVTEKCGKPYSDSILAAYWLQELAPTEEERAAAALRIANASADYAFPFRAEEIGILKSALEKEPNDAKAWYLLGNLQYYLNQKEEGIRSWEQSAKLAPAFGRVWRNLGFAYAQRGETDRAITAYENSLKHDVSDPRPFTELDILEAQKLISAEKRLARLDANLETILKHDDATVRLVELLTQTGQYERAIEILDTRHFHVWEGGRAVHGTFVDAHILRGILRRDAGNFDAAAEDFAAAGTYPENLEVAKGNAPSEAASELTWFQIASLKKLERIAEAEEMTKKFSSAIQARLKQAGLSDEFSKFGEEGTAKERRANLFYLQGLNALAGEDTAVAEKFFDEALKLNPNLIWPKVMRQK